MIYSKICLIFILILNLTFPQLSFADEDKIETKLRGLISGQGLLIIANAVPFSKIFINEILKGISDSEGNSYIYLDAGLYTVLVSKINKDSKSKLVSKEEVFIQDGQKFVFVSNQIKKNTRVHEFDQLEHSYKKYAELSRLSSRYLIKYKEIIENRGIFKSVFSEKSFQKIIDICGKNDFDYELSNWRDLYETYSNIENHRWMTGVHFIASRTTLDAYVKIKTDYKDFELNFIESIGFYYYHEKSGIDFSEYIDLGGKIWDMNSRSVSINSWKNYEDNLQDLIRAGDHKIKYGFEEYNFSCRVLDSTFFSLGKTLREIKDVYKKIGSKRFEKNPYYNRYLNGIIPTVLD